MSRAALFVNHDEDGWLDLVVANDFRPGGQGGASALFRNEGNGRFWDLTAGSGFTPEDYVGGGLAVVEEAGRGLPSIHVSYWTADLGGDPLQPGRITSQFPGENRFCRNLGGFRFEDATVAVGLDLRVMRPVSKS